MATTPAAVTSAPANVAIPPCPRCGGSKSQATAPRLIPLKGWIPRRRCYSCAQFFYVAAGPKGRA